MGEREKERGRGTAIGGLPPVPGLGMAPATFWCTGRCSASGAAAPDPWPEQMGPFLNRWGRCGTEASNPAQVAILLKSILSFPIFLLQLVPR